jgi:hypothetical protein
MGSLTILPELQQLLDALDDLVVVTFNNVGDPGIRHQLAALVEAADETVIPFRDGG